MNPPTNRRPEGYVFLYAVGTMVLVSSLALAIVNSAVPETSLTKRRMELQLARVAADAGIEWGMGIISHEMSNLNQARPDNPAFGAGESSGGPFVNPNYFPLIDMNWMKATTVNDGEGLGPGPTVAPNGIEAERPVIRITPLMWGGEGNAAGAPPRLNTQFQLALWPDLTYDNVKVALVDEQDPVIFRLRSRGEVIYDPTPGDADPGDVRAQATIIQSFAVLGVTGPFATPVVTRLNWELEPANRGPIPFNVH